MGDRLPEKRARAWPGVIEAGIVEAGVVIGPIRGLANGATSTFSRKRLPRHFAKRGEIRAVACVQLGVG